MAETLLHGPSVRRCSVPASSLKLKFFKPAKQLWLGPSALPIPLPAGDPVVTTLYSVSVSRPCNSAHKPAYNKGRTGGIVTMASQSCWRCLLRPSTGANQAPTTTTRQLVPTTTTERILQTRTAPTASFSTTAHQHAAHGGGVGQRTGKRMQLSKFKKTKDIVRGKAPLPGERKAWRKRIVLSNNNALPVHGSPRLDAENMVAPDSAGKVFKIPEETMDQLRASEAFKSSQTWGLFHSPHTLVRPETVEMCAGMKEKVAKGETLRMAISGDRASGKSVVLLQAMANAFLNEWVVINIPEGEPLLVVP